MLCWKVFDQRTICGLSILTPCRTSILKSALENLGLIYFLSFQEMWRLISLAACISFSLIFCFYFPALLIKILMSPCSTRFCSSASRMPSEESRLAYNIMCVTLYHFLDKGPYSQSYDFSSSHVQMWELDHKESWAEELMLLNCGVGEDSWEFLGLQGDPTSPSFIGRTNAEAPILWPPDVNSQLTGKDPDGKKDWGQEETGATEDEMVSWHHWLNGHEFEQAPGDSERQGSLVCCYSWGRKESDAT